MKTKQTLTTLMVLPWNNEKGLGERVLNLVDDMGRSINERLGLKRKISECSEDFYSSDEENESPNKKQRVEPN